MAHTDRRNPGLHSIEFPASAGPPPWRLQIPSATAADLNLRCVESKFRDSQSLVALQSRRFARDQYGAVRWAKVQGARDSWMENGKTGLAQIASPKYFSGKVKFLSLEHEEPRHGLVGRNRGLPLRP
jgi:hypothetical protein